MLGDEIVSIARRKRERLFHNGSRAESGDESEKEGERGRESTSFFMANTLLSRVG